MLISDFFIQIRLFFRQIGINCPCPKPLYFVMAATYPLGTQYEPYHCHTPEIIAGIFSSFNLLSKRKEGGDDFDFQ